MKVRRCVSTNIDSGWYFTPKCTGTRIIFFFGWFTGFFCYIAYSAQLVSILSVEVVPIKSWDDLIRDEFFIYNDNHIPTTKYFVKVKEYYAVYVLIGGENCILCDRACNSAA